VRELANKEAVTTIERFDREQETAPFVRPRVVKEDIPVKVVEHTTAEGEVSLQVASLIISVGHGVFKNSNLESHVVSARMSGKSGGQNRTLN
jgi:hypothetical protein